MSGEQFIHNTSTQSQDWSYDSGSSSNTFIVDTAQTGTLPVNPILTYGDFDNNSDITNFWSTDLDSVQTYDNISGNLWDSDLVTVTIDSGALKLDCEYIGAGSYRYSKAIPVGIGEKYKIAGTTVDTEFNYTYIYGGSTLGGYDYFGIAGSGASDAIPAEWEDYVSGAFGNGTTTFTATADTFYLRFNFWNNAGWIKFDDISLTRLTGKMRSYTVKTGATYSNKKDFIVVPDSEDRRGYVNVWDWVFGLAWKMQSTRNWEDWK